MSAEPEVRTFRVLHDKPPSHLEAVCVRCGRDLVVVVCGGARPHIGAAALGLSLPSIKDAERRTVSSPLLSVPGHKEEDLARDGSLRLSRRLETNVVVTVGIHDDAITKEGIDRYVELFGQLMEKIAATYSGALE